MQRKILLPILLLLAIITLCITCKTPDDSVIVPPDNFSIVISRSGNVQGDYVSASSASGNDADSITINYTLANDKLNNRLVFSGTKIQIAGVNEAGIGAREYTVNEEDAKNGIITINAVFTHTDKNFDTIAFSGNQINKTYGDSPFTVTVSNSGQGTGAITYSSGNTGVATVNSSTGEVSILKAGSAEITATKAADTEYEGSAASYTLNIAKAAGAAVAIPTLASKTHNSITVNTVNAPGNGQTVEYAASTNSSAPQSGWQSGTTLSGLTANTDYYVYARSAENVNYNAGTAQRSALITTDTGSTPAVPPVIVDFESDNTGSTTKYTFTRGDNDPALSIVSSPANGTRALKVVTNAGSGGSSGYNQAAVIPISLPYALENWASLTFKINVTAGTISNQTFSVYAASSNTNDQNGVFKRWGFGNPSNNSNQFAHLLLGEAQITTTQNSWQNVTIPISNPGSSISGLKGAVYLAIGTNQAGTLTYHLDDITFTISSGFVPPPPPPPGPDPASFPAAVSSGQYRNLFEELGKTTAQIDAKVQNTFNRLFVNGSADQKIYYEVGSDMAYILDVHNNDVRSEGMSYGMMMCVQMNDKTRFDRLWKWARTYMYNDRTVKVDNVRGYFSWACQTNGNRKDQNPAPDGEFYFVTSLLFASARWGDGSGIFEYGREARNILYDMIHRDSGGLDNWGAASMFNTTNHLPVFSTIGSAANHTDPSYNLPAFYEIWAIEIEAGQGYWNIWGSEAAARVDAQFYRDAATASRTLFHNATNATTGLGPDYSNFNGTPVSGQHADFRHDAWRIAMNIGMDYAWWKKDAWQLTFADRIQGFFHSKGVNSYGQLWTLSGSLLNETNAGDHSPGLAACNAVATLAASQAITWDFVEDLWNASMTSGTYRYYDGCLYMLGLLHVSGKFKAYLSNE